MPRKARFHPSVMHGGPAGDDDSWNHAAEEQRDDDDVIEQPQRRAQPGDGDDRIARMEAEITRLKEDNSLMRRAIPPAEPTVTQAVEDDIDSMSDEDFDALLFSNPRRALELNNAKVARQLRNEYTTNQGTNKFWEQFYTANSDLKDDDDLVQSTLQKNMAELGNMPVDKAQNRLAELTRDRILGFMKKTRDGGGRKRAVAEGANPPTVVPRNPDDDDKADKPMTLGGLLRGRKDRRRKAAQAA